MQAEMIRTAIMCLILLTGCDEKPKVVPLTVCPEGARLTGAFPPLGYAQRCEKPGGIRHGPSRFWHKNGQRSADTEWRAGRKHGNFRLWYPDGQKRAEGRHDRMKPVGLWKYWDETGKLLQRKDFGEITRSGDAPS